MWKDCSILTPPLSFQPVHHMLHTARHTLPRPTSSRCKSCCTHFFTCTSTTSRNTPSPTTHADIPDHLPVQCKLTGLLAPNEQPELQPADTSNLCATLRASQDRRGNSQLTQLLATSCQLSTRSDGSAHITGALVLPATPLTLSPLYSKRMCETPLAQQLVSPCAPGAPPETGYLTMDQARSLLPLTSDDPNVSVVCSGCFRHG